mgnify:CR=1 FL=1
MAQKKKLIEESRVRARNTTLQKHGEDYFRKIGAKGGKISKGGGRPRKEEK